MLSSKLLTVSVKQTLNSAWKLPAVTSCSAFHSSFGRCKAAQTSANAELKELADIPGPPSYPLIGSLPTMIFGYDDQRAHLLWEKLFDTYGPIVRMKIPGMPMFVASINPDDVENFLKSTMKNPVRVGFFSLEKVRREAPIFEGKAGLLIENNEEWKRVRSRTQAPLMKPKNVAMYLPQVDKATLKFMNMIDELQRSTGQVPDDFQEELYKWALECIGVVALEKELGCLEPDLKPDSMPIQMIQHVNTMFQSLNTNEMNFHWWKLFKTKSYATLESCHKSFTDMAENSVKEAMATLEEAQKKGDPNRKLTIIETFLQTEGMKMNDIITVILDMLFAGVDTTSHTVAFTLFELAKNQEAQKKLQAEIDRVMGESVTLRPEHIAEMIYLNRVLKESLRMHPLAIGNARSTTEEMVLSGYKIPPGVVVMGMHVVMCRKEENFKRANEFIPERWDRERPLGEIHPFASLPFSFGTRMCIGKRLAEQEIYVFLIRALQKYNITFESNEEMRAKNQLVLKPDIALPFKFHPRT